MNLKLQQFQKLNKRERTLTIAVAVSLSFAGYWYAFLSPNIKALKELNSQTIALQEQYTELKAKTNTDVVKQQVLDLQKTKTDLELKIATLKDEKYVTSKSVIADELSTLGEINNYELVELERNSSAIKYSLRIEHASNYDTFIKNIKRLETKYPQLFFTNAAMKNNIYTSEWTLWLKQ